MYLGDGYIVRTPRTYVLRIFLNARQLDVVARVERAIQALLPDHRVGRVGPRAGAITVTCYFRGWPNLVPQHGPGRKHARHIVLETWQREIVDMHAVEFLHGLIDSDGCRHRRIVNGRDYPAYSFTNHSRDILRLFASACTRLGVHDLRSSATVISIARRGDVRRLDRLFESATDADDRLEIPTVLETTALYRANSSSGRSWELQPRVLDDPSRSGYLT